MSTLGGVLARTGRVHGDRLAIVDEGREFTWRMHVDRVARLAGYLVANGLPRGSRFGILAPNSWRQAELLHAGYWAGVTPVPMNVRLAPRELRAILLSAACARVMIDPALFSLLDSPELADWRERAVVFDAPSHDTRIDAAAALPMAPCADDDEALLLYTGGTAGAPKGVPLQHRQVLANAMQVALAWPPRPDDLTLHVAPMFHSADLVMTGFTLQGAAHAYLPRFTPELFLQTIQRLRVSVVMMVPTMLMMLVESGLVARFDCTSLKRVLYGASPMTAELIARVAAAFPNVEFTQGYGLTETAPLLAMLDAASHREGLAGVHPERLRSCGKPLAGVELKIVADDGSAQPAGAVGEIVVRGPNVFAAYLDAPQQSAQALRDGWFHTGDVGVQDSDGFVHLLDRKNDVVISGGENVFSAEVEAVLSEHPGVAEVAVIGVPDARYGEAVMAVVVCRVGSAVDEGTLRDHCRGRIGAYKIPRRIAFVDGLPRSAMGKVLKTTLRQTYAAP